VRQQWPVHRAIMVVDVERFGDPARTNLNQLAVRDGLYKAVTRAFMESGVAWDSCVSEDRGDGALILVPPEVPKTCLVTVLLGRLTAAVSWHNARCAVPEQMRLRVALHAGEVYRDAHGVAGAAVNHTFRLADAPALRSALDASPGVLALIVSDWLFGEVVRHDPAAEPGSYRQVQVIVKETAAAGWIRVPDPDVTRAIANRGVDPRPRIGVAAALRADRRHAALGLAGRGVMDLPELRLISADGAIRARRPIPAQLPHDVLGFTGREPELAALDCLAADRGDAAVVISAIDGIAGIGKTGLAVHFAHRVAASFSDGQLFVNLRGFDPDQPPLAPRDVLPGFLRGLGADPSQLPADPDELAAMYRSMLSGRRILIVLDNAASAEQVRPLLPGTAGCLAIVTSRNRLSSLVARDGAQRLTLDVLTPDAAVSLITRIAGTERAAVDPAAVGKLAQLCGWLPLALRITADRAATHRHLTMTDLVEELALERDRLDALSTDEKTTQVRAVFSWSYQALTPGPARAFRLLSLHPGPDISAQAAAALLDAAVSETRQLLRTLTGGHLLEETGRDRYRFHDLVRVYAAECARASEPEPHRAAAVRRLLTWYLHTADAFFRTFNPDNRHVPLDPPPPACRPPVFTTHRQAVDWAQGELANLVPIVRLAALVGDDASVWKFPVTLVPILGIQRRFGDLVPALHSALIATQQLGDRTAEAWVLTCCAEVYFQIDPTQAAEYCQRALAISAEVGDAYGQWAAPYLEGICYLDLGRSSEALDCFQQALTAACRSSNLRAEGMSLDRLGLVDQQLGSFVTAIDLHRKALAILNQTHSRWPQAFAMQNLANAYRDQGCIGDAVDYYQRARTVFSEMGDHWAEATLLIELGQARKAAGQPDEARESWQSALNTFEEFGDARTDQVRALLLDLGARRALFSTG
jgi:tetratricopeptide (TPR) repeat protein